jgi:N-methylhydantoinase B
VIEIGGADGLPISLLCNFERVAHPARGRGGGKPGASGRVTLRSGRPIGPKGRQTVPGGDMIRLELPGGGGHGDPRRRDRALVAADVADGVISRESAEQDYGVTLPSGGLDDQRGAAS